MRFLDGRKRTIEIEGEFNIEAYHGKRQIGTIDFDEDDCGVYLYGMNVDQDYQKAGIGTAMMRIAAEIHGKRFRKPSFSAVGGRYADSSDYFTIEGAALIHRCIKLGILEDTEASDSDDLDDY